jgi:hypothetical protein
MPGSVAVFPSEQFLNVSGQPVANGTLTVYAANTLTLAPTWTDKDQTTLNTNPIILNALGEPPASIWLNSGSYYDMVLKDSLGATIRTYNDVVGANSSPATSVGEWMQFTGALTYVDPNTFTTPGNQTVTFQAGRKILCYVSPGLTIQGTVISSTFTTSTSVIVRFPSVSTVLNAGLTRVDLSLITPLLSPIWAGDNGVVDLTGYSGADVVLGIGQAAVYDVSAITTLPLRIATGDNQLYELRVLPTNVAGATFANPTNLQPNNANTGAGAVTRIAMFAQQGGAPIASGVFTTENVFVLDGANTINKIRVEICTRTNGKTIESNSSNTSATSNIITTTQGRWSDTVTAWASLGTINFGAAITGRISVRRIM